jgi:LemA protein
MRETRAVPIRASMLLRGLDGASAESLGSTRVVWLIVILVVVALLLLGLVLLYNRFVQLRNRVDNAWAQIEVQLKRRWDLIPNLVETVRGYAEHERGTFEAVTEARANAQRASGPAETAAAEGILGAALGRLFAVAEAYPELQADENFRQLQDELAGTENRIAVSRQVYNDTVLTYNNAIQTFPGVLLAGPFGFLKREFFETDETQREVPQVDFTPASGAPAPPPPAAPSAPPADPGTGGAPGGTT